MHMFHHWQGRRREGGREWQLPPSPTARPSQRFYVAKCKTTKVLSVFTNSIPGSGSTAGVTIGVTIWEYNNAFYTHSTSYIAQILIGLIYEMYG